MKNLMTIDWCDFGCCSHSCRKRCQRTMDRWDGAPTLAWREGWRVMQARGRALARPVVPGHSNRSYLYSHEILRLAVR